MIEILPLLVFTTFAGIAAGAYVVAALSSAITPAEGGAGAKPWVFPLVCMVLLAVGLVGTLAHLGQPLRFINGMMNPGSMISQECYWAIAFGVLLVVDVAFSWFKGATLAAVRWVGAVAACGLMVVTGLAYQACAFMPAWSDTITVPVFAVGDLALGMGLYLLFAKDDAALRALHLGNLILSLAWLAVIAGYGVHLAGIGEGVALVVAGGIIGPVVSGALSALWLAGNASKQLAGYGVLVCMVVGTVLVRAAFFAAGVL